MTFADKLYDFLCFGSAFVVGYACMREVIHQYSSYTVTGYPIRRREDGLIADDEDEEE